MTTIGDKFSALGTSIINLVGTRASKNMDNLSATGQANIAALAGGIPQTAIGNVCLSANPAHSGTTANTDFTVTGSFVGLSPTSKDATTGAPINTKITLSNVNSLVSVVAPTSETGTSAQKLTMFINSSGTVIARKYVASYTAPAHASSDLVWYDLNNNRLKTYASSWSEYAGFAIGEFLLTGSTVSNVVFYKSVQLLDAASLSSPSAIANVPTGTVISYMGTDVPEGFLLMDGRYLSKTAYANLYSVIGDTQTTTAKEGYFQIADMTDGRYLMGSTVAGSSISQSLPDFGGSFWLDPIFESLRNTIWYADFVFQIQKSNSKSFAYINATPVPDGCQSTQVWFQASRANSVFSGNLVRPFSIRVKFYIRY